MKTTLVLIKKKPNYRGGKDEDGIKILKRKIFHFVFVVNAENLFAIHNFMFNV
jgi:hypothetical protein